MSDLPQAIASEETVLGAMIYGTLKPADTKLTANDFYLHPHQEIFAALSQLTEEGKVSPALLSDFLRSKARNATDERFTIHALSGMATGIPFGIKFDREIKSIIEASTRRKIIQLAHALQERAISGDESNTELIDATSELLNTLRESQSGKTEGFRPLSEIAAEAAEKYAQMARGVNFNIPTGISEIDRVTRGGISPGDVWIIGAFTGHGKSALALQMARSQAEAGYQVGVVSREMLDLENFERIHSAKSETPLWLIKPGMKDVVYERLQESLPDVANLSISINSQTGNIFDLRRHVKRAVEKDGLKILYVDYLQLLEATDAKSNWSRANEIEKCSRLLKTMAMDFQIAIISLAQYNRSASYAGKAENHNFAESSAIEKDASVILHLDLEKVEPGEQIPKWRKATIRIGKGRQSPQIETTLSFRGECFTFSDENIADLVLAKPIGIETLVQANT